MATNWTKPNHNMSAEYQGSGMPYVTSSQPGEVASGGDPIKIGLPGVSRWFEVRNTGPGHLRIGFTSAGVSGTGAATGSNPINNRPLVGGEGYGTQEAAQANHQNYYVLMSGSTTGRWELKTGEIWINHHADSATDFSVVAGITNIPRGHFVLLSGSDGWRGVG
jgi:hypothetical protein